MAKKKSSEHSEPSPKDTGDNGLGDLFSGLNLGEIKNTTIHSGYEPFRGLATGSLSLDYVFGKGQGIARGQVTQIDGPPGTGKTSLTMLMGIHSVAQGMKVAILPMEGRWNQEYAAKSGMGYPGRNYFLADPETAEDCFNNIVWLADNDFDLCIVDSVAGMATRDQFDGEIGDSFYAPLAKAFSNFFKMRMYKLRSSNMALVFLNQQRTKMNVTYGDPLMRPGGQALEFYTSSGLHLDRPNAEEIEYPPGSKNDKGKIKADAEPIGMIITGKTWKNTLCSPFRQLSLPIRFAGNLTINREWELATYGKRFGIFRAKNGSEIQGGANWCYDGEVIGDNQKTTELALRENSELAQAVEAQIRQQMILT